MCLKTQRDASFGAMIIAVVFYIAKDLQTLLSYRVYRHELGTPQSSDVLVYEEQDDAYYISLGKI